MDRMKDWLTIRNGVGTLFLYWFFKTGTAGGGIGNALIAMASLIVAACFFSKTLCGVAACPLTSLIDAIYFGNNRCELPPVSLKLARVYRQEFRHADAISECERQLEYHPHSLELWTELIHSAQDSGDAEAAGKFRRKALRRLKVEDRKRLEREIAQPGAWTGHGECRSLRQP